MSGQTDEGEMGITYRDLENYFKGESVSPSVLEKIEKMKKVNEHKRAMPPIFELKQDIG